MNILIRWPLILPRLVLNAWNVWSLIGLAALAGWIVTLVLCFVLVSGEYFLNSLPEKLYGESL